MEEARIYTVSQLTRDIRAVLEEVFHDAHTIQPQVDKHPEYQQLVARLIHLYKEIMDKAMQNEGKA